MSAVTGGRHTIKAVWIEVSLSPVASIPFLLSRWVERLPPNGDNPFDLHRAGALTIRLFREEVWTGWAMVAVPAHSIVLPAILARRKLEVAQAECPSGARFSRGSGEGTGAC